MMYELRPYNGKKFGPGLYSVANKLIRKAAKVTKRFAADIFYNLQWMENHMDEEFDLLIMIHEEGLCAGPVNNGIMEWESANDMPVQCWRVRSDGKEMWTERVTLREVK